jgi:hypothetical protein
MPATQVDFLNGGPFSLARKSPGFDNKSVVTLFQRRHGVKCGNKSRK